MNESSAENVLKKEASRKYSTRSKPVVGIIRSALGQMSAVIIIRGPFGDVAYIKPINGTIICLIN